MRKIDFSTMLDTTKLRTERERQSLSMAQAGKLAKMTAQQWEQIENSDGLSLTLRTLNKIAVGLKIPAKDLLK
jgi:transcriptional regulator with XRE-family HTH domain